MASDQRHREGAEKSNSGIKNDRQKNRDYCDWDDVHVEQGGSKGNPVQAYYTQK